MAFSTTRDWSTLRRELGDQLIITGESPAALGATTQEGHPLLIEYATGVVEWLVVRAWVCQQTEMDPELVLERNGRLAFSSLALIRGAYWLRTAVPVDSAEAGDLARLVVLAVEAARSLSPVRVQQVMAASALFSHYAE